MKDVQKRSWQNVLSKISERVSAKVFGTWFNSVEVRRLDSECIELGVPNLFFKKGLTRHSDLIIDAVTRELQLSPSVRPKVDIYISPELFKNARVAQKELTAEADSVSSKKGSANKTKQNPVKSFNISRSSLSFNKKFSLDNFIVGESNLLAHSASKVVVEQPASVYNPLFIYGGTGLGKTHLLQGICQAYQKRNPSASIIYVSCEAFLNEYVTAARSKRFDEFRARYRNTDLLAVDDIHFLGTRERTQEEFLHTFDALHGMGRQVLLTSDAHVSEIGSMQHKLITRFSSGLIAKIETPDFNTRVNILRSKAIERNFDIDNELLAEIASQIDTHVRALEGALTAIMALAQVERTKPTIALVRRALALISVTRTGPTTMDEILKVVTNEFNVDEKDIRSRKRTKTIMRPRQVAMFTAKHLTDHSLAEIGEFFGKRDHATVVYSEKRVKEDAAKDEEFKNVLLRCFKALGRRLPNL